MSCPRELDGRRGPEPVAALRGLRAYHVPKAPWPIDLPLHGNEGPAPSAELFHALTPELVRRYPSATALEALIADQIGLTPAEVIVTAGADEAIDRAFRAFVAPGDAVVLPSPTFVMFPQYARLAGARLVTPPWPVEDFPEAAVLDALTTRPKAVALVSPNNPTGAAIPTATIRRVAQSDPSVLMMIDFAYVECADEDPTAELARLPNALVFRTLSKVWGLAGLRVGYACGPEALIRPLRAAGGPYSVASTSLALAAAQLTMGAAKMREYVARVRSERDQLYQLLSARGAAPVRSAANFVFARFGSESAAMAFSEGLARRGIGVRAFPGDATVGDGLRITCPGDEAQQARLLRAIEGVSIERGVA